MCTAPVPAKVFSMPFSLHCSLSSRVCGGRDMPSSSLGLVLLDGLPPCLFRRFSCHAKRPYMSWKNDGRVGRTASSVEGDHLDIQGHTSTPSSSAVPLGSLSTRSDPIHVPYYCSLTVHRSLKRSTSNVPPGPQIGAGVVALKRVVCPPITDCT